MMSGTAAITRLDFGFGVVARRRERILVPWAAVQGMPMARIMEGLQQARGAGASPGGGNASWFSISRMASPSDILKRNIQVLGCGCGRR